MTKAQQKRLANKKAKLRQINKQYKLDDTRARHFVLCVIIGLMFMVAVVYAPIIPESYIKNIQLPGEEITYPNEVENKNVKLPDHLIISGSRQEPLELPPQIVIETHNEKSFYERVLEKDGEWVYKKIEEKKKLITKKKVKNFAIMQVLKLFLGIPIVPGQ